MGMLRGARHTEELYKFSRKKWGSKKVDNFVHLQLRYENIFT